MTPPDDVSQKGNAQSDHASSAVSASRPASPPLTPTSDAPPRDQRSRDRSDDEPRPEDLVPTTTMWVLTLVFALIVVVAMDVLFSIWPSDPSITTASITPMLWGMVAPTITVNDRFMLIAVTMGVIGAMVHGLTSFADFVGNHKLEKNWLPWYLLRPVIGSGLALFFYVGFRAGLLTGSAAQADVINPFGIAAIGGLAGMFSKQATDKLSEVFTTMFKTSAKTGDDQRDGKLGKDAPTNPTGTTTKP